MPASVRTNDDPIFDWLKRHDPHGSELFKGYVDRRVLAEGEGLDTLMVPAAMGALRTAGIEAGGVDLLMGTGSVSEYQTPNELARLHALLGMPARTWVVPLQNDFSNFNAALYFADALVRAGRIRNALIVVAGNWTRYVDYHTPQSVSAADGAGAAVIARSEAAGRFEVVDAETTTDASYFGTMFMRGDRVRRHEHDHHRHDDEALFTSPTFHITAAGQQGFQTFGATEPPKAVARLLERNHLKGSDISLVSHQASSVLIDAWQKAIGPAHYLQTLEQFANVTVANVPLDFAYYFDRIPTEWLVLLAIGVEMHTNALLLRRSA